MMALSKFVSTGTFAPEFILCNEVDRASIGMFSDKNKQKPVLAMRAGFVFLAGEGPE
jgi:hypothetical protein